MSVWGVTMVKDEIDVIASTLGHMVGEGVDGIVIADNMSSDGTFDEIHRVADAVDIPVIVIKDDEVAYYQSEKMTSLANMAAELYSAEWIVPFDADELWTHPGARLVDMFTSVGPEVNVIECSLYNHVCTGLDEEIENPFIRIKYIDPVVNSFTKVAFRWTKGAVIKQGNHDVGMEGADCRTGGLIARHFPVRSFEHFKRKAENGGSAYAATNMPLTEGDHWRTWGAVLQAGEEGLREIYEAKFFSPDVEGLMYSPAPLRYP